VIFRKFLPELGRGDGGRGGCRRESHDLKSGNSVMTLLDPERYDDKTCVAAQVESDPTWDREKEIYLITQELIATVDLAIARHRTDGHTVRTQHGVTASAGQRRGDVELRRYLQDAAGLRSLVFDLSITPDSFGNSRHVQQNAQEHACTASFCVFFSYRPTGRPRRTSLPMECHRNATNRTRFVSSALRSTSR
jgi:hypothetical protein